LPFNDGTPARNPIYHLFFEDYAERFEKTLLGVPTRGNIIIQANWMSQPTSTVGLTMRQCLRKLGVFKIVINPYSLFESAKVRTCTVYWKQGYQGKIEIKDRETKKSSFIKSFDDQILLTADPDKLDLLYRLKPEPYNAWSLHSGNSDVDEFKWRVVTSYRKENFEQVPLNHFKVIPPYYKSQGGYRVFYSSDDKADAEEKLMWYQSFWHSNLVTFILKETRVSTTLDDPQIAWVPKILIDHEFTDQEIFDCFNLTEQDVKLVNESC
jgi:hypothetical protein